MSLLSLQGVGKRYRLYASQRDRFKALITGRDYHSSHQALHNVSLELHKGQCLGVIGDNGAGKSTFLKLIAGALQPSEGKLHVRGRLTAILELGAGFHPDFTGRENLRFGGSLIGIDAQTMCTLEPSIIEFSELGDAIDRPVKTYSSGMAVRLAFALVTAVEPDILIVDEALAVGDQHFQKKCIERIDEFRRNGCTILFCSHSLYHVRHICTTALWLDKGEVRALGETDTVLADYEMHVRAQESAAAKRQSQAESNPQMLDDIPEDNIPQAGPAGIVAVKVLHLDEGDTSTLHSKDLNVCVSVKGRIDECPSIGVMLEQANGVGITSVAMHTEGVRPVRLRNGLWQTTLVFPDLPLHSGEYVISVYLFDSHGLVVYDEWKNCVRFKFLYPSLTPGLVRLPHHWK